MKVGRREFLKLFGAAAGAAIVPKVRQPEMAKKDEWHHVAMDWSTDSTRGYYVDGEGPLSLEEYAKRMGIGPGWIFATKDRCDCPECQAALVETEGWVREGPYAEDLHGAEFRAVDQVAEVTEDLVEYDCDYYLAISEGAYIHEWIDPLTGIPRYTELAWGDHGLHTVYLADGQYLGPSLSKGIDPFDHVRSIWAAGLVAAMTILRR